MEKMLKQDEIDAPFRKAARTPDADGELKEEIRAKVVPTSPRPARISTEQLRAISMLNDLFARTTHNLAALLRTRFHVNLVSAEQIPFNEFLLRVPEISYVASVRLEPWARCRCCSLKCHWCRPSSTCFWGGRATRAPARADRDRGVHSGQRGGNHLPGADRGLAAGGLNWLNGQMLTQVARVISVTEKTLCLCFEIRMPHSSGLLNLAVPAVVANAILERLTADFGRSSRHPFENSAAPRRPGAPDSFCAPACNCPRSGSPPNRSRTWSPAA